MKACVATGEKRCLECRDIPVPAVEPGMLLLKTIYACVCGSDLEYLDGSFALIRKGVVHPGAVIGHKTAAALGLTGFPADGKTPVITPGSIPGHEFVAEVVAIGEGVNGWKIGDRAVPGSGIKGVPQPPASIRPPNPGYETYRAFAEYIHTSPLAVQKVPQHVPDKEAVFVEPLATGIGSVIAAGTGLGKSLVIIGAGKIGLLTMMSAKVQGAAPVIMIDVIQERLEKAAALGADAVINAAQCDAVNEVVRLTGDGADAVIISVRDGSVLNQAVEMTCRGGTIVLAGFVPPVEVNPMLWTIKQLKIVGILGGPAGGPDVMSLSMYLISHQQVDPGRLISEIISFSDCQRAIDSIYQGKNIAVLLEP